MISLEHNLNKLSFTEAQELYKKYLETRDIEKKKELKDELILGTIYIIYDYLEKIDLNFNSINESKEDIFHDLLESLITEIMNGSLLVVNNYDSLIKIILPHLKKVKYEDSFIYNCLKISSQKLIKVIEEFLEQKKQNKNYSRKDFIILASKYGLSKYYDKDKISEMYLLCLNIYDLTYKMNANIDNNLFIYLITNYLNTTRIDEACVYLNFEDSILDIVYSEDLVEYIFNEIQLTELQKDILKKLYGLNNQKEYSYSELSSCDNKCVSSIKNIESRAIKSIKVNRRLQRKRIV